MNVNDMNFDLSFKNEVERINRYAFMILTGAAFIYLSSYFFLFVKGQMSGTQFSVVLSSTLLLLGICAYIYFTDKSSKYFKVCMLITFFVPVTFLLFTRESVTVYTCIFPMIMLAGLYNNIKFSIYSSAIFLVLNIVSVIPHIMRSDSYVSDNMSDLASRFVIVTTCALLQIVSIKIYDRVQREKEEIQRGYLTKFEDILSNISAINEGLNLQSDKIYSHSEKLSKFSLSGTKDIENFSSVLSEFRGISSAMEQSMTTILKASDEAASSVILGNKQMEKVISSMEVIQEKCAQINEITNTVNEIAFQTNILALNASVEAAHAGAQGKGFSVVAEEVRSLSNRSAEAANSTATLLDNTLASVEQGNRDIEKIYEIFKTIHENTQNTTRLINEIYESAGMQQKKADELEYGLGKIRVIISALTESAKENTNTSNILSENTKMLTNVMSDSGV